MDQPTQTYQSNPDEINLLEYIYALVKHKWLIIGLTLLGFVAGHIAAIAKGPTWIAEAAIAPKDVESQKTPSFAGLGAIGGLVASQLNFGGNASLDKIDLILDSREFGAKLIDYYSLLPTIYKLQWPKVYTKSWDPVQKNWRPEFICPKSLSMGAFIRSKYLKKQMNDNKTLMTLQVKSCDSTFSFNLGKNYIEFLNDYIKSNVQAEAQENVSYLEKQLIAISDPLLREKIQSLIAIEIEKKMMVSKEAFKIMDPIYLYKSFKEKKVFPLVFGAALFFMTVLVIMIGHAFSSAEKIDENRVLIERIKNEIWLKKK